MLLRNAILKLTKKMPDKFTRTFFEETIEDNMHVFPATKTNIVGSPVANVYMNPFMIIDYILYKLNEKNKAKISLED